MQGVFFLFGFLSLSVVSSPLEAKRRSNPPSCRDRDDREKKPVFFCRCPRSLVRLCPGRNENGAGEPPKAEAGSAISPKTMRM